MRCSWPPSGRSGGQLVWVSLAVSLLLLLAFSPLVLGARMRPSQAEVVKRAVASAGKLRDMSPMDDERGAKDHARARKAAAAAAETSDPFASQNGRAFQSLLTELVDELQAEQDNGKGKAKEKEKEGAGEAETEGDVEVPDTPDLFTISPEKWARSRASWLRGPLGYGLRRFANYNLYASQLRLAKPSVAETARQQEEEEEAALQFSENEEDDDVIIVKRRRSAPIVVSDDDDNDKDDKDDDPEKDDTDQACLRINQQEDDNEPIDAKEEEEPKNDDEEEDKTVHGSLPDTTEQLDTLRLKFEAMQADSALMKRSLSSNIKEARRRLAAMSPPSTEPSEESGANLERDAAAEAEEDAEVEEAQAQEEVEEEDCVNEKSSNKKRRKKKKKKKATKTAEADGVLSELAEASLIELGEKVIEDETNGLAVSPAWANISVPRMQISEPTEGGYAGFRRLLSGVLVHFENELATLQDWFETQVYDFKDIIDILPTAAKKEPEYEMMRDTLPDVFKLSETIDAPMAREHMTARGQIVVERMAAMAIVYRELNTKFKAIKARASKLGPGEDEAATHEAMVNDLTLYRAHVQQAFMTQLQMSANRDARYVITDRLEGLAKVNRKYMSHLQEFAWPEERTGREAALDKLEVTHSFTVDCYHLHQQYTVFLALYQLMAILYRYGTPSGAPWSSDELLSFTACPRMLMTMGVMIRDLFAYIHLRIPLYLGLPVTKHVMDKMLFTKKIRGAILGFLLHMHKVVTKDTVSLSLFEMDAASSGDRVSYENVWWRDYLNYATDYAAHLMTPAEREALKAYSAQEQQELIDKRVEEEFEKEKANEKAEQQQQQQQKKKLTPSATSSTKKQKESTTPYGPPTKTEAAKDEWERIRVAKRGPAYRQRAHSASFFLTQLRWFINSRAAHCPSLYVDPKTGFIQILPNVSAATERLPVTHVDADLELPDDLFYRPLSIIPFISRKNETTDANET